MGRETTRLRSNKFIMSMLETVSRQVQQQRVSNKRGDSLQANLYPQVVVTFSGMTSFSLINNLQMSLIIKQQQLHLKPLFQFRSNIYFAMLETQRQLTLNTKAKSDVLYQEQFYSSMFYCCFTEKKFVIIKHRTLYIYEGAQEYQEKPDQPHLFFNLNYADCKLQDKCVKISNNFVTYFLRHPNNEALLKLLEAIDAARKTITAQDVYPNKLKYFESAQLDLKNK